MISAECPVNECHATIPIENDWQIGAIIRCPECDRGLLVSSVDPPKLDPLAPDRDDDPRGELAADHGGQYTLQELIADIIDNSIDAAAVGAPGSPVLRPIPLIGSVKLLHTSDNSMKLS